MSSPSAASHSQESLRALLRWYAEMGVDDVTGTAPTNAFELAGQRPAPSSPAQSLAKEPAHTAPERTAIASPSAPPADEAIEAAKRAAAGAASLAALAAAVADFEGCPLKKTARSTVFFDGALDADLLVIGEAPGRDEDRIGRPFVGRAGQLLDRMLAAIGRSRDTDTLISNVIFWRPPGNRTPTKTEIETCRPFVEKLIELLSPKAILLAGGAPTQAILGVTGIMRARGVWREYRTPSGAVIPALPIFHPAFLLRQPAHKRLAWADLQALEARLTDG